MNAGLLPTVGIFHRNCYNAFPLADDMMEPYRPYIDGKVMELYNNGQTEICQKTKKTILDLFYLEIPANAMMLSASTLAGVYDGTGKIVVFPKLL